MPRSNHDSNTRKNAFLDCLALLSRAFWGPDRESCRAMLRGDFLRPFEILSSLMPVDPSPALAEINAFIATHNDPDSLLEPLEESYVRLFISHRDGIAAPLYQSCYTAGQPSAGRGLLMGTPAAEMQRRLRSVGLGLDEKISRIPDHLSVELEYLYYLIQDPSWTENSQSAKQARSFCADVMLPWILEFKNRLGGVPVDNPFYPRMADLLVSLVNLISGPSPPAGHPETGQ